MYNVYFKVKIMRVLMKEFWDNEFDFASYVVKISRKLNVRFSQTVSLFLNNYSNPFAILKFNILGFP